MKLWFLSLFIQESLSPLLPKPWQTLLGVTFEDDGVLALPPQWLQDHMQRLGERQPARVRGALVVNHNLFGEDALIRVLALTAGYEVQHSDLALLQPTPADLVGAIDVHGPPDVALVVLHEGPAVNDNRYGPHRVSHGAAGHPFGQLIGVDDPHGWQGLWSARGETGGA